MGKKLWITVLLFLMLILRLSVSQPNINVVHLTRLQAHLIALYQQYQQNASAVELERFMDLHLLTRTHGIIELISGWSPNKSEEAINVQMSTNYIRSIMLYASILYADLSFDSYFIAGGLDIDAALQATEIYQIRKNFLWTFVPSDEIARFELAHFNQFNVQLRDVNDTPYIQFFSTYTESSRFYYHLPKPDLSMLSLYNFMPLRQNPQRNLLREVEMLTHVQKTLLNWMVLYRTSSKWLQNQVFSTNPELRCGLLKLLINSAKEQNIPNLSNRRKFDALKLVALTVFQRYIQFVRAEYDRHVCHPAHIKYAYVLSANLTTMLNENHIKLEEVNHEVTAVLDALLRRSNFLFSFNSRVSTLPLRVGYVRHRGELLLRIALACENQAEN